MKEVDKLPLRDFTRYCMSIAQVPSSYLSGLTMEEQLLWLCSFLTNEVIPTVNNNGEAVEELQNLYVLLKDYVDNYFDNLDIQEEVNTKLEEMAQSGELAELISQYLEAQAIIGFNTCSSLSTAQNLANGSFARTLGKDTYNDGKGAFYKIRTRTNADVPDGYNIIVLTNTENLVAEKMPDYNINTINTTLTSIQEDIDDIEDSLDESYVLIGDSYGAPNQQNENWVYYFNQARGLTDGVNSFNICRGAAGFIADGTNTYLSNLQNNISSITNKNGVKYVIIAGGWNDRGEVYSITDYSSISNLVSYCKTQFPNAKIYCGMITNYKSIDDTAGNLHWRDVIFNEIYPFYKHIEDFGGYYLNGVETVMHNYDYFKVDDIHPNADGCKALGIAISQALNGTFENNMKIAYQSINSTSYTLASNINATSNLSVTVQFMRNKALVKFLGTLTLITGAALSSNSYQLPIALNNNDKKFFRYVTDASDFELNCRLTFSDSTSQYCIGKLNYNRNGTIYITFNYGDNIKGKTLSQVATNTIIEKELMLT